MARPPNRWKLALGAAGARVVARERTLGGSVWLYTYDRALRGLQGQLSRHGIE